MPDLPLILEPETPDDADAIIRLNERVFGPGRFARTAYRLRETTAADLSLSFVARVGTAGAEGGGDGEIELLHEEGRAREVEANDADEHDASFGAAGFGGEFDRLVAVGRSGNYYSINALPPGEVFDGLEG